MASDLLLPGVIAHIITTLYNPNNVAAEAAPATLGKEPEVGVQLAEMFGYETDSSREPCAWGHLTSGGTLANYEGLRNILAVRLYLLALAGALEESGLDVESCTSRSTWELVNLSIQAEDGVYFGLHIDAAWGGYPASVFRTSDGDAVDRDVLRNQFHYFPSQTVYDAFGALRRSDSITVDPHKLGYVPYPAGAYVAADRRTIDFISQSAAYVFDVEDEQPRFDQKLHHLGRYILEGSKPGSSAATVHVTHRVLPLNEDGFGRILKQTVSASEYFFDAIGELERKPDDLLRIEISFEPDSNLVCLAFNPVGNESPSRMNAFGRKLFGHMKVDPSRPIQQSEFIASYTSLLARRFPHEHDAYLDYVGELIVDELG